MKNRTVSFYCEKSLGFAVRNENWLLDKAEEMRHSPIKHINFHDIFLRTVLNSINDNDLRTSLKTDLC